MNLNIIAGWLGGQEILIILVIVLLLFGGKKIPELMRGLGKGIREFKDASKNDSKDTDNQDNKKE
jgi:sec-independent protein translocase protein TatA